MNSLKYLPVAAMLCLTVSCGTANTGNNSDSDLLHDSTPSTGTNPSKLFNGESLEGWHTYGKDKPGSAWNIDSNAIHLQSSSSKGYQTEGGGDLITDDEYGDFDLKLDWKISKNGNSGVLFYVQEDTSQYKETWNTGMEMQVLDNNGHPDAKIIKHRAGDLYDLITSTPESVKPAGEWNSVEVKSLGGKLDFYLNGEHTLSTTLWDDNWNTMVAGSKFKDMKGFGTFKKGHIALQDHGNEVWFRNISIQKL